ncbi:hypothetical protein C5167_029559, partial [Papaver somniferum]
MNEDKLHDTNPLKFQAAGGFELGHENGWLKAIIKGTDDYTDVGNFLGFFLKLTMVQ